MKINKRKIKLQIHANIKKNELKTQEIIKQELI